MDAMCAARDAIMARTAGYDWYWIILYLLIIALFLFTAHQTYYKYILPNFRLKNYSDPSTGVQHHNLAVHLKFSAFPEDKCFLHC